MSKPFIFKSGSIAAQPFAASLREIAMPAAPKKRSQEALEHAIEHARAEGFAQGREEGFEVGRTTGYQAGFDQAYSEASNKQSEMLRLFATELQSVHDRLEASIATWFEASERELEIIAVQIAEHLIGTQLQLDRSVIVEATKSALHQISEANKARIRVNPFDSAILDSAREELLAASAGLRGIEIVDDVTIQGGCVIETERGAVDATIETRLELLKGGLEDAA